MLSTGPYVWQPCYRQNKCQDNLVSKNWYFIFKYQLSAICFSLLFRLWRRKVHLIWRSSVASAVFHLLAVLCFACWCWVFPWWWQNLMPWLPHQPIEHSFPKIPHFPQLTLYYGFSRTLSNYQDRKHRLTHTASGQFLLIRHQLLDVPSMSDLSKILFWCCIVCMSPHKDFQKKV